MAWVEVALPRQRPAAEHDLRQHIGERTLGVRRGVHARHVAGRQREARTVHEEVPVHAAHGEVGAAERRRGGQPVQAVRQRGPHLVVQPHLAWGHGLVGHDGPPQFVGIWCRMVTWPCGDTGPSGTRCRRSPSTGTHWSSLPGRPSTPASSASGPAATRTRISSRPGSLAMTGYSRFKRWPFGINTGSPTVASVTLTSGLGPSTTTRIRPADAGRHVVLDGWPASAVAARIRAWLVRRPFRRVTSG